MSTRNTFLFTTAIAAVLAAPAVAQTEQSSGSGIETVTVTAERRTENLQTTPIAVTALSPDDLASQRILTGANLATVVPNMAYQTGLFGKENFAVRGIGYQLITATGEPGVSIDENEAPISTPRIAQADFFDVQQIEVLRGPQGTLYGRNATGGVVNVITAKPTDEFSSEFTAEGGNYGTVKANGYINIPIDDMFALRVAGDFTRHDGYQFNVFNGDNVNGVNLWSGRATLSFKPSPSFRAYLMFEQFSEDDTTLGDAGTATNACQTDPGPTSVGGVSLTDGNANNTAIRNYLSFGCTTLQSGHASIYAPGVVGGILNGVGTFGNRIAVVSGFAGGNLYALNPSLSSPYDVNYNENPFDHGRNELAQANLQWDILSDLELISLTTYDRDHEAYGAGGGQAAPESVIPFFPIPGVVPFSEPQIENGTPLSNYATGSFTNLMTEEYSEEVRLVSSFNGPVNFSVGAFYLHLRRQDDVLLFDNANGILGIDFDGFPVDHNPPQTSGGGHYYFQSLNPVTLTSKAVFGETYWDISDDIRLTGGLRWTDDKKTFLNNSSAGNLLSPFGGTSFGFGFIFTPPGGEVAQFEKLTGRAVLDWRPHVDFTDSTMFYASFSRGYKAGGFNPPNIVPEPSYGPESVDAYEIGTKNEFLNHTLQLNLTGFYYNYYGYQFTQAAGFGTVTSNLNAHIYGGELESKWAPITDLLFNAQMGLLNTRIQNGPNAFSIDQYNPTQGIPNFFAVRTLTGMCVVNATNFGNVLNLIKLGAIPTAALFDACDNAALTSGFGLFNGIPAADQGGVPTSIAGNRLPNVPNLTLAFGGQYTSHVGGAWTLTPRFDFRLQGGMFTDLFNNQDQYVRSYDSVNLTLTLYNEDLGLNFQAFAQNLGEKGDIVGARPGGGAITGSERTVYIADPPLYGIAVSKRF